MATNVIALPRVGKDETFVNTEYVVGTQIHDGQDHQKARLLIYLASEDIPVITLTTEDVPLEMMQTLNLQIVDSINGRSLSGGPKALP